MGCKMKPTELFKYLLMSGKAILSTKKEVKNSITCSVVIEFPERRKARAAFLDPKGRKVAESKIYDWDEGDSITLSGIKVLQDVVLK